jgi:hypothetical protein
MNVGYKENFVNNMAREVDVPQSILERIPSRDKEVILLAPIFFWAKYMRRNINTEGFEPVIPEVDFNDLLSIGRAGFDVVRQVNSDVDGDVVGAVSDILTKHPKRAEFFPHLSDQDIWSICSGFDQKFEEQEFVMQCESSTHYEGGPEEFAISAADETLWLQGGSLKLGWFSHINDWKVRRSIIQAVLKEKLSGKISGLLSSDENGKV